MAEVNTGDDGKAKKGKPKRLHLRVDFTPMVDMNMLLITFFMFCTTLSKPQMMNLAVPSKEKVPKEDQTQAVDTKTITLLLAENDIIYYYLGKPEDATLMETDYSPDGLRAILTKRNSDAIRKIKDLREEKRLGRLSDDSLKVRVSRIRDAKDGQIVVIKPMETSTYENLVNVLDEIQICSIGIYALSEIADGDKKLIENYLKNK